MLQWQVGANTNLVCQINIFSHNRPKAGPLGHYMLVNYLFNGVGEKLVNTNGEGL